MRSSTKPEVHTCNVQQIRNVVVGRPSHGHGQRGQKLVKFGHVVFEVYASGQTDINAHHNALHFIWGEVLQAIGFCESKYLPLYTYFISTVSNLAAPTLTVGLTV